MDVDARADLPMQPLGPLQPGPSGAFRAGAGRAAMAKGRTPSPPPRIWPRCAKKEVRGQHSQEGMRQGTKGAGAQDGAEAPDPASWDPAHFQGNLSQARSPHAAQLSGPSPRRPL